MVLKNLLREHDLQWPLRGKLETLQVNLGRRCNMTCAHCHVNAGPAARDQMSDETADAIIRFLFKHRIPRLDLTGGAPELALPFRRLVTAAADLVDDLIVRCNLTVIFEPGMEDLPEFYTANGVHLVCSLPCYTRDNVDRQRGEGAFDKSIAGLKKLNDAGYGRGAGLTLDLVYNPGGAFLPGSQLKLEADYKRVLGNEYGIVFDRLITITNMPINRFGSALEESGRQEYLALLAGRFNPAAVYAVMCRYLVSVGYDGRIYDCDFNQALDLPILDDNNHPLHIGSLQPDLLAGLEARCADHCLGCVAGEGSSCSGTLS